MATTLRSWILRSSAFRINSNRLYANATQIGTENDLILSESCINRLKEITTDGSVLRVTVDGGGCSGFQYKFDLDKNEICEDDRVFEKDGVQVVVDSVSLSYIKGSTIDFDKQLIRSAFRITNNPVAADGCSCGASFSIKI